MEDFKKERTRLVRQFTRLVEKSTNNNDEIVLCEDGKESDNTYPLWGLIEIDMKSPKEWINSILFHTFVLEERQVKLSLKLKKV